MHPQNLHRGNDSTKTKNKPSPEGAPEGCPEGGTQGLPEQSNNRVIEESNERKINERSSPKSAKEKLIPSEQDEPEADTGFQDFWTAYGKKVGRAACEAKWKRMTPARREAAMAGVQGYTAARPDPIYRKDPVRYLTGETWRDEQPTTASQPAQRDDDIPEPAPECVAAIKLAKQIGFAKVQAILGFQAREGDMNFICQALANNPPACVELLKANGVTW